MSYSIDPISDNCYPGTTVLVNKLNIRDKKALEVFEVTLTSAKSARWLSAPEVSTFDFAHYKAIHFFIFSELYDWAGRVRSVDISKKGTTFCPAAEIDERASRIFHYLKKQSFFCGLEKKPFVEALVDFYCETNMLHPFREGNGRTQRIFLSQLAQNAGYTLDFSKVDGDLLMIATIHAAHGVTDLLRKILEEAI